MLEKHPRLFQIWVYRAAPEMQNAKCKMQNQGTRDGSVIFSQKQIFFRGQRLFGYLIA
jgi:hypothetical protein